MFIMLIFLVPFSGRTQPTPDSYSLTDFSSVVSLVESAYAGFGDKTKGREVEYSALKSRLSDEIAAGRDMYDGVAEYLGWFEDFHLDGSKVYRYRPKSSQKEIDYDAQMEHYEPQFVHCKVDDETYLIRFPSCAQSEERKKWLGDALSAYRDSGCENLIVDIRDNAGGNDGMYEPILQQLYDHPASIDNIAFRVSDQSIAFVRKSMGNTPWGRSILKRAKRADNGTYVDFYETKEIPLKYDKVQTLPRRAALIIDRGVASAGEDLVLEVRASSDRTTIFGRDNTVGCIDDGNCVTFGYTQDSTKWMMIPLSRSNRVVAGRGVDSDGIAPDVRIDLPLPRTLTDNVDEWVLWVAGELKKN